MNEKKRLYIVLSIFVLFFILVFSLVLNNNLKQKKVYNEFVDAFNKNDNTLVYIGRPTCTYCNYLNPSLEDMKNRYNFDYIYLNIDEINSSTMSEILSYLNLTEVGTPYLAVVGNGKLIATQNGYKDYDVTFNFLQKNGIISEDAKLSLNYISYDDYITKKDSDEINITVIGKSDCVYCIYAKPVLNQLVEDKNIEINYLNLTYLEQEDYNNLISQLNKELNDWGTPTMLLTQSGKIVDILSGYVSLDSYVSFLIENEVL